MILRPLPMPVWLQAQKVRAPRFELGRPHKATVLHDQQSMSLEFDSERKCILYTRVLEPRHDVIALAGGEFAGEIAGHQRPVSRREDRPIAPFRRSDTRRSYRSSAGSVCLHSTAGRDTAGHL